MEIIKFSTRFLGRFQTTRQVNEDSRLFRVKIAELNLLGVFVILFDEQVERLAKLSARASRAEATCKSFEKRGQRKGSSSLPGVPRSESARITATRWSGEEETATAEEATRSTPLGVVQPARGGCRRSALNHPCPFTGAPVYNARGASRTERTNTKLGNFRWRSTPPGHGARSPRAEVNDRCPLCSSRAPIIASRDGDERPRVRSVFTKIIPKGRASLAAYHYATVRQILFYFIFWGSFIIRIFLISY